MPLPLRAGRPGAAGGSWSSALRVGGMVAAGLLLLLVLTALVERVLWRDHVLVGVRLPGASVAGQPVGEARQAVDRAAAHLERAELRATAAGRPTPIDPATVRLDADQEATFEAVRAAGRSGNPVAQLLGVLVRRVRPVDVDWRMAHDRRRLDAAVAAVARRVDRPPADGTIEFDGVDVTPVAPRPGAELDRAGAAAAVAERLDDPERRPFALPMRATTPRVDQADVDAAARQAAALLEAPIQVTRPAGSPGSSPAAITLAPQRFAQALRARPDAADGQGADGGGLTLTTDAGALRAALGPSLAAWERPPTDARFTVAGDRVRVVPGKAGAKLDAARLGRELVGGRNPVRAALVAAEPKLTTQEARALGITRRISTFTTRFPPGEPRVRNIQRGAQLLHNDVVPSGGRFSLNQALGPRTLARGFVEAPVIYRGEFEKDVGGGVSQIATTVFNAAFFAGVPIEEYQAHTYYISRYPMGREATVSDPKPDLVFANDYESAILVRTSTTASSITVAFYGRPDGRKVSGGEPRVLATRAPGTETVTDPEKVQPGYPGYDVEVFRTVTKPGAEPVRRRFFTRYEVANRRVLAGSG
jgi:vancomycin resistance protein YoaR